MGGIDVYTTDGRVHAIYGTSDHPISNGKLCPKGPLGTYISRAPGPTPSSSRWSTATGRWGAGTGPSAGSLRRDHRAPVRPDHGPVPLLQHHGFGREGLRRRSWQSAGFQSRERKLDALRLLRAMVISAATGYGGRQADVMRIYFESGGKQVVRGGFYRWFGTALEAVM